MKCNYVGAEQSSSYSPVTFINDLLISLIALHLVCKTALSNTVEIRVYELDVRPSGLGLL